MDARLYCLTVLILYPSGYLRVCFYYHMKPILHCFSVDVDITKPDTGYLSIIERPHGSVSKSSSDPSSGSSGMRTPLEDRYAEPDSEGEEDELMDLAPARDEDKRTGLSYVQVAEASAYRAEMLKRRGEGVHSESRATLEAEEDAEEAQEESKQAARPIVDDTGERGRQGILIPRKNVTRSIMTALSKTQSGPKPIHIDPLAPSSAFDETLRNRLQTEKNRRGRHNSTGGGSVGSVILSTISTGEDESNRAGPSQQPDERLLLRSFRAPAGKRISVPVRVEPKVYFAAERTFLVSFLFRYFFT
jgi:hypothetical protein